ncbi:MAG: PKD domain-containing protein, partial [candidate division WOR-3 bacterium]
MDIRTSAVLFAASIVLALSCVSDVPPTVPLVRIAETAQPGDTMWARVRSTDRNRGFIAFLFDWGDGSDENWSAEVRSGDTLSRAHAYPDTGRYSVRVKARDQEGNESEWTGGNEVVVAYDGPFVSDEPRVPETAYPDTALWFTVSAGHVREDSVSIQFDWGDGQQGEWSGFVAPGSPVLDSHRFAAPGRYSVKARATDRDGN